MTYGGAVLVGQGEQHCDVTVCDELREPGRQHAGWPRGLVVLPIEVVQQLRRGTDPLVG
jgi:hypothetical protein